MRSKSQAPASDYRDLHYLGAWVLAVYLTAGISNGHLNCGDDCAVAVCLLPKQKVLPYIVQFAGAFGGLSAWRMCFIVAALGETAHHMVRGSVESLQLASIFSTYPAAALNAATALVEDGRTSILMGMIVAC
ncbi:aquaporin [Salmonella enterica subsp. enterica]|nr:aquaporin [Salmonella enterica subsp. enterica]